MARRFELMDENTRQLRRYNAVGSLLTGRLIPPSDNSNLVTHFLAIVNDLFDHALRDVDNNNM